MEIRTDDSHTIFEIHTASNTNSNREANKTWSRENYAEDMSIIKEEYIAYTCKE